MAKKRTGIFTGGGDVPGLNSVIKSVVYRGAEHRNCSAYIREWVTRQRVGGSASEQGTDKSEDPADV